MEPGEDVLAFPGLVNCGNDMLLLELKGIDRLEFVSPVELFIVALADAGVADKWRVEFPGRLAV
jgi:hypothetical protein